MKQLDNIVKAATWFFENIIGAALIILFIAAVIRGCACIY